MDQVLFQGFVSGIWLKAFGKGAGLAHRKLSSLSDGRGNIKITQF